MMLDELKKQDNCPELVRDCDAYGYALQIAL
jgi:hypothetical protein